MVFSYFILIFYDTRILNVFLTNKVYCPRLHKSPVAVGFFGCSFEWERKIFCQLEHDHALIVGELDLINSCFFLFYERLISGVSAICLPRRILLVS